MNRQVINHEMKSNLKTIIKQIIHLFTQISQINHINANISSSLSILITQRQSFSKGQQITSFNHIEMNLNQVYFVLNNIWYYGNLAMIPLFFIGMVNRFRQPSIHKPLWTDHLTRVCLIFTIIFYIFDIYVKYHIDGDDTICQKSFFIHHISSLFLLPPLIINKYIPWFVGPVGFFHGICIFFPDFEPINYVYALFLFVFQYGIYQKPYRELKGYWFSRYCMNFIWVFALLLLVGDCSNYLPLQGMFI